MKQNYSVIDGHGHILPNPDQIPQSIKDAGYFNIIGAPGEQFMTQDFMNWKRPVSHPSFFVGPRLEWMEKNDIAHTVMITLSQLYCNGIEKKPALDIMKFQNDFHLELQETYPNKFSCGFVVNPLHIQEALVEFRQRANEGLQFLCLPTHYQLENGKFASCTDSNCQQLFELADKCEMPIHFHPYNYEEMMKGLADLDMFGAGHVTAMAFLTNHLHYQFTCRDLHNKYPRVRFNFSHGNVASMFTEGRKEQWFDGRPDLFTGSVNRPEEALWAPNIFFDTIVHDPHVIHFLKKKTGTTNMIFGIDSPYPLGDGIDYVKSKVKKYPTFTLDEALKMGYISGHEKILITTHNALRWLYGHDNGRINEATEKIFG